MSGDPGILGRPGKFCVKCRRPVSSLDSVRHIEQCQAVLLSQEAIRSNVAATETLEERIKQIGQKTDKNFSQPRPIAGGDYVRYESAGGQPCIGIRKYGPSTTGGFKWIMVATRCDQKGKTISDQDIASFMASADYRK
jgi:hypothetical protein